MPTAVYHKQQGFISKIPDDLTERQAAPIIRMVVGELDKSAQMFASMTDGDVIIAGALGEHDHSSASEGGATLNPTALAAADTPLTVSSHASQTADTIVVTGGGGSTHNVFKAKNSLAATLFTLDSVGTVTMTPSHSGPSFIMPYTGLHARFGLSPEERLTFASGGAGTYSLTYTGSTEQAFIGPVGSVFTFDRRTEHRATATTIPLVVVGAASQSADLVNVATSAAEVFAIGATGQVDVTPGSGDIGVKINISSSSHATNAFVIHDIDGGGTDVFVIDANGGISVGSIQISSGLGGTTSLVSLATVTRTATFPNATGTVVFRAATAFTTNEIMRATSANNVGGSIHLTFDGETLNSASYNILSSDDEPLYWEDEVLTWAA